MLNHRKLRGDEQDTEAWPEFVRALSGPVIRLYQEAGGRLDALAALRDALNPPRSGGEEAGNGGDGPDLAACIERLNHPFRVRPARPQGRVHAQTPGDLCRRLLEITRLLDRDVLLQNDVDVSPEVRNRAMHTVAHLHSVRSHLRACLLLQLQDIREGNAVLPPHPDMRRYPDPYMDPVTSKEVAVDVYAFSRKADTLPRDVRHILALACNGHGASLAYLGRDGTVRSSVLDRWAGTKYTLLMSEGEEREILECRSPIAREMHDLFVYSYGNFPKTRRFEDVFGDWVRWLLSDVGVQAGDIDLFISSESNFVTNAFRLAPELNRWLPNARIVTDVEHHTVHQRQAFWQSGFDEAAVLTLDTCGESLTRLGGHKISGTIASMDVGGRCRVFREFLFPHASAGLIYSIVNHHLGFSQGQEGKTMGLAPYGGPDLYDRLVKQLRLYPDGSFDFLSYREIESMLRDYEGERPRRKDAEFTAKHCDIAFAGQALIEDILCNAFQAALRITGSDRLVYAGGLALNSVANEKAYRAAKPAALYIPPNPSDAGQALGGALYAAHELAGWEPTRREIAEYLGPRYGPATVEEAVRSFPGAAVRPERPLDVLARCIANGHIVARFAGPAEFGPRALGNRSILADPRRKDMKEVLNRRVKRREGFRPFAPSVLLEHAAGWFDLAERSPYMLRVVNVPHPLRDRIPAIVHVDGTARVQTVDRTESPDYWELIHAFFRLTGVPLVLNTSFNVAGKPIVETPADAVACFMSTEIDVLLLEGWILSKRPLGEFEHRSREERP
jgi:carbamoyltransferase